jgi:fructokinase
MGLSIGVLGEALMDCIAQPDGRLLPLQGGSPYNMARAAALRGAQVTYLNPLSTDLFGQGLADRLQKDGVTLTSPTSRKPTSLAVVQLNDGQPSYGFYREGIADRDYTPVQVVAWLQTQAPGILHTGSLLLIPPEHHKVVTVLKAARQLGWTISVDINLRPKVADELATYVLAVREVMALADWLKASDEDLETLGYADVRIERADTLVDNLRREFRGDALSRIALTFGAQGAHLDVTGMASTSPVPCVQVTDTVGAGDTFWGNIVADWATTPQQCGLRVSQTLQLAMAAAAINCTRQGCQPPTATETQAFG